MKIGSDGSLCRITSKATQHNNAMVVVVPENELEKSKGPPYKILIIGSIQEPCESSDTESDEEISEEVSKIIESNIDNGGKANNTGDKKTRVNESRSKECSKANRSHNRYSSKRYKNKRPSHSYRFNKHHNSSVVKRSSYPENGTAKMYSNTSSANKTDINPWLINPINKMMVSNYQYSVYPQFPVPPAIEPCVPESSTNSVGLLGYSPYSPFPPPKQTASDQNYWNERTAMNYWNNSHSNNYQRPVPTDTSISNPKSFQHGNQLSQNYYRQWRRNKKRNARRWNKPKNPKDRVINTDHYNYDQ